MGKLLRFWCNFLAVVGTGAGGVALVHWALVHLGFSVDTPVRTLAQHEQILILIVISASFGAAAGVSVAFARWVERYIRERFGRP